MSRGSEREAVRAVGKELQGRRDEPVVGSPLCKETVVFGLSIGVDCPGGSIAVGVQHGEELQRIGCVERFGIRNGEVVAERESVGVGRDALYGAVIGCDHIVVEFEHRGVDMVGIGCAADILSDDLVVGIAHDGIGKVFDSHRLVVDTLRRMRP